MFDSLVEFGTTPLDLFKTSESTSRSIMSMSDAGDKRSRFWRRRPTTLDEEVQREKLNSFLLSTSEMKTASDPMDWKEPLEARVYRRIIMEERILDDGSRRQNPLVGRDLHAKLYDGGKHRRPPSPMVQE